MRNETRYVLLGYAMLAWCLGFFAFGWCDLFISPGSFDLGGMYLGRVALYRIFAAIVMASGCFAAAFVKVDDPLTQRNGLFWLAGALGIVSFALFTQVAGPWGPGIGERAMQVTTIVALCLAVGAAVGSRPGAAKSLRSQYEQQIRSVAAQEERNRLARDLHDSIKQQIFAIHTAAATAQTRFDADPSGAKEALEQVRGSAREAMTEMEVMLDQLGAVPLENASLIEALKKQCEALGFRTGAKVEFKLGALPSSDTLPPGAQQAIFRVAQEALANVARHARATNVSVSLDSGDGAVVLTVQDDGAGFDLNRSRRGMGTANMQARAEEFGGEFDQVSQPGVGTSVRLSIPCIHRSPQHHLTVISAVAVTICVSMTLLQPSKAGPWIVGALATLGVATYLRSLKRNSWKRA